MSISVADRLKNRVTFPFEVFPKEMADSMQELAQQSNIPADFIGSSAIFTISALSGNQYNGNLNGKIKPIVYVMLIGPSGSGKTPAFNYMCGNIINQLRGKLDDAYKIEYAAFKERLKSARELHQTFTEKPPRKKIRLMEDATEEAISKHAETSPAGFGLNYDEGGRFFGSASQYKKENSTVHFWNQLWNGQAYEITRVDSEKDRFISNPAISVMIGMQTERLTKYFTEDVIQSGLAYRFLMCHGEFKPINELVDYFDNSKKEMCESWKGLVRSLFHKGANYLDGTDPFLVDFTQDAKIKYNEVMGEIAANQNVFIRAIKKEDENMPIIAAGAKLQAYVARLALILSIIDDHTGPRIQKHNIEGAYKLYKYYKRNSDKILLSLNSSATTGLTENEAELLGSLPDNQFTTKQAEDTCAALNLNKKFFLNSMNRKYKYGWIKIISKGIYEKI